MVAVIAWFAEAAKPWMVAVEEHDKIFIKNTQRMLFWRLAVNFTFAGSLA
jgi:hypothetical protein